MANNRMFLVNESLGLKVLLGKYYPSTGWYVADEKTLSARINMGFHAADFGNISFESAQAARIKASGGLSGNCSWRIQYDVTS